MRNTSWSDAVATLHRAGNRFVIATVVGTSGSTPRHTGNTKMVIDADDTYDTVGGGQLEYLIVHRARALIADNSAEVRIEHFPLALEARQCCGGAVTVLLEAFAECAFVVTVFGAGHVAQRLVPLLAEARCRVTWVDSRAELLSGAPQGVVTKYLDDPVLAVNDVPVDSYTIVLTHEHSLDYTLVKALLAKPLRYVGLIGSATKAVRFRMRLAADAVPQEAIARLVCPIGAAEGHGELPIEIAVAIANEVFARERARGASRASAGMSWREIKQTMQHLERS